MKIARVSGRSLEPGLRNGSFAVFRRKREIMRGDIVLVRHPDRDKLVKRVATITLRGRISLHGMAEHGATGEGQSSVARREVLGTLMFRIPLLRWRKNRYPSEDTPSQ